MATLQKIWINVEKIDKAKLSKTKGGTLGFAMMVNISDEPDKFGNNVSSWMDQTKEEKDAKANRTYIGNGTAIWSDGKVTVVNKDNPKGKVIGAEISNPVVATPATTTDMDKLPF